MAAVLVTGGAGFIGSHLTEELVAQGHSVTIYDNLSSGKRDNLTAVQGKITFIEGDIRDLDALKQACAGNDYIFHLAAIASVPYSVEHPHETHDVNSTGTLNVLLAARHANAKRVIYSSTAAVYGDEPTLPKTEESALSLLSPYALTKLTGEQYVLLFNHLYGIKGIALRYFNVYGPRQDPASPYSGVITKFVDALKQHNQPTIFGDGNQTRDFVFVKDVVNANIAAMTTPTTGKPFNIATGIQTTINELFAHLKDLLDSTLEPTYAPARTGDIIHSYADITKAQQHLNYTPKTSFKDGLRQTIDR